MAEVESLTLTPPDIIASEDLVLRRSDLVAPIERYQAVAKNREFWGRYFPEMLDQTAEGIKKQQTELKAAVLNGLAAPYDVYNEAQNLGNVALHSRQGRQAELSYYIDRDHLGKNVAARAARAIMEFGFEGWELGKVLLMIRPTNSPSQDVARKLGARPRGRVSKMNSDGWFYMYEKWEVQHGSAAA